MSGRDNLVWILIGASVFVLAAGYVLRPFQWGGMMGGYYGGWYGAGSGMMYGSGWMGLGMILFWGLVVAGVYLVARSLWPRYHYGRDDAREIARERYARGEITQEEYEELRRNLA